MPPLETSNDLSGSGRQPATASFDAWAVLDFWRRRWGWLAAWTLAAAVVGGWIAHRFWGSIYTSNAELVHAGPAGTDDAYHPRDLTTPSLVVMLQSPELMDQLGAQLNPRLTAEQLAKRLEITADRNNDVVMVSASAPTRAASVDLANRFCAAAIAFTQNMQRQEANQYAQYVASEIAKVNAALATAQAEPGSKGPELASAFRALGPAPAAPVIDPDLPRKVQDARDELGELLTTYTEVHPLVIAQREKLSYLENLERQQEAALAAAPAASAMVQSASMTQSSMEVSPQEIALAEWLRTLEQSKAILVGRATALQPFRTNPPGYFRVLVSASPDRAFQHRHRLEVVLCAMLGAFVGFVGSAGEILLGEFLDNRIKTRADVRRVTGLPLIATLGDLNRYSQAEKDLWAFRTWTALQSHLSLSPNHGMVCGVTSARHGEGRSTWVELLARAAGSCGFRVLTVTARPQSEWDAMTNGGGTEVRADGPAAAPGPKPKAAKKPEGREVAKMGPNDLALSVNVLTSPAQITEQLASPAGPPRVNIPLPGWVWNLERRKQWRAALEAWRAIDHIVIFVELPPASEPESVLLGENIPNLIWLVESGRADAAETHTELATLRDARCHLVGAVLNRERTTPVRGRFTRWLGSSAFVLFFALMLAGAPAHAQDEALTADAGAQRAAWQERLTLGPGDVLTIRLFGTPLLTRENVAVGPDGRISYLEAQNVPAAGLTVDELRDRLDRELGRYRRAPQAMIEPVAFRSKQYYVLGAVVQKGAFVLDRPVTVVEAVALAHGFDAGGGATEASRVPDFHDSFLSRGGRRVPIDFERLFLQGDLSQNVALQPGDYLYIAPPSSGGQIFVLGAVREPGPITYLGDDTALSAIADRGGFTPEAWTQRVLVVHGSLDHPQPEVVNLRKGLLGEGPNAALQPGDIVYVASRPWYQAEQILEHAADAFVESATVTWTDIHAGPNLNGVTPAIAP